jgi:hypothetical protein
MAANIAVAFAYDHPKSVTLTTAGTLSDMISDEELTTVDELTVSGPVNGSDIFLIRCMAGNLKSLNLKDANIVAGGRSYYLTDYTTQDDVIGDYMFYSMTMLEEITLPKDVYSIGSWYNYNSSQQPWNSDYTKINGYPNKKYASYNSDYSYDYGCSSFYNCINLRKIVWPENNRLVSIAAKAFTGCLKLQSLEIPEGVEFLGEAAFSKCDGLTTVKLPSTLGNFSRMSDSDDSYRYLTSNGVYFAGCDYTFYKCTNLTDVTIAEGTKYLMYYMFKDCTGLKSINLPSSLLRINGAFNGCSALEQLTIPESVTSVGNISGCSSITTLTVPAGIPIYEIRCSDMTSLTKIEFKNDSGNSIGEYAFDGCSSLSSINALDSVLWINNYAFRGCEKLDIDLSKSKSLTYIGEEAFNGSGIKKVEFGRSFSSMGAYAFQDCKELTSVTCNIGTTTIPRYAFDGCEKLSELTLPNNLLTINEYAFRNCYSLQKVLLPMAIQSIGSQAFANSGLTEVTLQEGLTSLGSGSFSGCGSLKKVTFPTTMKTISGFNNTGIEEIAFAEGAAPEAIAENAFNDCDGLRVLTLPESIKTIGESAFYDCDSLREVTIPSLVTEIPYRCFSGCSSLSKVSLQEGITSLDKYAFRSCPIEKINFPSTLTNIDSECFYYSYLLRMDTLDLSATKLTTIGSWFQNDSYLKVVKLPDTATTLASSAFYDCPIEQINFPSGITSIPNNAFKEMRMDTLKIPSTITEIGESAFYYAKFNYLSIPSSVKTIGNGAFYATEIKGRLEITPNDDLSISESGSPFYASGSERFYDDNGYSTYRYWHLPSVYWNSTKEFPKNRFGEIDRLYLPTNGKTSSTYNIGYVFYNGKTNIINVDYNSSSYSFSVSDEMTADTISYSRQFSQNSGYGEAAGWQTIVLPFDVTEISYTRSSYYSNESVSLAPFGSDALNTEGTLPFWLYELGSEGSYVAATQIKAHHPYLICMPNNDMYPSENNISGTVTFRATDATNGVKLETTEGKLQRSKGTKFDLVPTYDGVYKNDTVYALNESRSYSNDGTTYKAGSVFIKNYNTNYYDSYPAVYPFRAYLVSNETTTTGGGSSATAKATPEFYPISGDVVGSTGIYDLPSTPDKASKAYAVGNILHIVSDAARTITIYDPSGRAVRSVTLSEGDNEVSGLEPGIYLLEGQKVVISK